MCNLYDLDVAAPFIKDRFRVRRFTYDVAAQPRGLVRPSVRAPVVHLDADGEVSCSLMEWGFVRQWKNEAGKLTLNRLFNVRSETIDTKPTFAKAYRKARAIIPASAYFELPEKGVRVRIAHQDGRLLALAGLWEEAQNPKTGEPMVAFTMAMTDGSPFTAQWHDRMPCLLDADGFATWLDPSQADAKRLLIPYPHDDLVAEREAAAPAPAPKAPKPEPASPPPPQPVSGDLFG